MQKKSKFPIPNSKPSSEAGVTLLLTVMILAGLTLISVSVGGFAIQQLRSARAGAITEPAIGAAETAGEQGLWAIKRTSLASCPASNNQSLTSSNSIASVCKSAGAATFNLKAGAFTFYLYDPDDINGDVDLSKCNPNQSTQCYNSISISNLSGTSSVSIDATRLDGSTTGLNPSSPPSIVAGQTQNITVSPVSSGTEGRIKVVLTSTGDDTVTVNTTPNGMPNFPTVDALGCSANSVPSSCNSNSQDIFSRRINITVPQ